ncbi:hypothetical protein EVAR_48841_1 [Eumeta japonica]|uniref:Uncharacterized protein n=1 Tax=Eumeta variegata TaxID=151549 RepID=A0A4C1YEH3_EUMVA|nr:hypothetical protein EVAR_48841_1 [Eumeta japonica]
MTSKIRKSAEKPERTTYHITNTLKCRGTDHLARKTDDRWRRKVLEWPQRACRSVKVADHPGQTAPSPGAEGGEGNGVAKDLYNARNSAALNYLRTTRRAGPALPDPFFSHSFLFNASCIARSTLAPYGLKAAQMIVTNGLITSETLSQRS